MAEGLGSSTPKEGRSFELLGYIRRQDHCCTQSSLVDDDTIQYKYKQRDLPGGGGFASRSEAKL